MQKNMDQHSNFLIQLHRKYPQLAQAVQLLVKEINQIRDLSPNENLEVEATFGKLHYTQSNKTQFHNVINEDIMSQIENMLNSFTEWTSVKDWWLIYDYYTESNQRFRVHYESKEDKHVECIQKQPLTKQDFSYASAGQPCNNQTTLRNYLVRVNLKVESKLEKENTPEITRFNYVRTSVRKSFVIDCKSVSSVQFQFDLIKFWEGKTLEEVETRMKNQPPGLSVECEILNLPKREQFTENQKILVFTSLLLKMQDFLDYPHCYNKVEQDSSEGPLPIFCPV